MKEDVEPPIVLPGYCALGRGRGARRKLKIREGNAEHDGKCDAKPEGRQDREAEHSTSASNGRRCVTVGEASPGTDYAKDADSH
jgi:hypothetical protein